jgi:hypothetical protein
MPASRDLSSSPIRQLGTGGSPSGLHSSPLILSGGDSPGLDVYIYSAYLLDISEGLFTLRISLCAFVGLVRRPLSVSVGLLNWRITNTATETSLASLRHRPLSSLSVQLPNRGQSQSKTNAIGAQTRSDSLRGVWTKGGG